MRARKKHKYLCNLVIPFYPKTASNSDCGYVKFDENIFKFSYRCCFCMNMSYLS